MRRMRWIAILLGVLVVVGAIGYMGYVGYEGSRQMVSVDELRSRDCRTPDVQFGWAYEAINYDIADDDALKAANPDMTDCASQGAKAGDEVVTKDGIRIAGWYVPAANGIGPTGPTVVLMHGFTDNKSGILPYGVGLHDDFNLVTTPGGCTTSSARTWASRSSDGPTNSAPNVSTRGRLPRPIAVHGRMVVRHRLLTADYHRAMLARGCRALAATR
ncbi:MAG TPA: hypothetical protein VF114_07065 [Candidatus Limnocylindria bacterium]